MAAYKNPIQRSIIRGCIAFVALLSWFLALQAYFAFSRALYERCDDHLRDALVHVEKTTDLDDLRECMRTGIPSTQYNELQYKINRMVDDFELQYLYICIPVDDGTGTMISVCSSVSEAERAAGEVEYPLMFLGEGFYTTEQLAPYVDAWNSDALTTFEGDSDFGLCYTMCKPLTTAEGDHLALLCADLSVQEMHNNIRSYVLRNVGLTVFLCAAFGTILIVWLSKNVTGPILSLEKSAQRFVRAKHEAADFSRLANEAADIHTDNELESLADAIAQMSREMKNYVEDTEARAQYAEQEAEGMARVAYQDPLTHVKNKAAYDAKRAELEVDIANNRAEFAIVMLDLNNLKRINDTYGHENGNKYIIGGCMMLCGVYDHSPVYRVGGDEFIAVLLGRDYENRAELFRTLQQRFRESRADLSREPWERYSAAAGMAEFNAKTDQSVDQVFRRADQIMYRNKKEMKEDRTSNPV